MLCFLINKVQRELEPFYKVGQVKLYIHSNNSCKINKKYGKSFYFLLSNTFTLVLICIHHILQILIFNHSNQRHYKIH
jgi:hypothetical protein